jgi:hypothetical protein
VLWSAASIAALAFSFSLEAAPEKGKWESGDARRTPEHPPSATSEAREREWQERREREAHAVLDQLKRLVKGSPEDLAERVDTRLAAGIDAARAAEGSLIDTLLHPNPDPLFSWAQKASGKDHPPIPDAIPSSLVAYYLDSREKLHVGDDCEMCGLVVPTYYVWDKHTTVQAFAVCPACGGRTGFCAFSAARSAACWAAGLGFDGWAAGLPALVANGYRPGERLDDWLARWPQPLVRPGVGYGGQTSIWPLNSGRSAGLLRKAS